ncbi:MAG: hypothetical protein AAGF85_03290 [Bacteroidota bacterium]
MKCVLKHLRSIVLILTPIICFSILSCSESNEGLENQNLQPILLKSIEWSNEDFSAQVEFIYNTRHQVVELISNNRGTETSFFIEYDDQSRAGVVKMVNDTIILAEYDSENLLSKVIFYESENEREENTFSYNDNQNIVGIIETNFFNENQSSPSTTFMSYDQNGNVIEIQSQNFDGSLEKTSVASYDSMKNPIHLLSIPPFLSWLIFGIDFESSLSKNNMVILDDINDKVIYSYEYQYQNDLPVRVEVDYIDSFEPDNIFQSQFVINYRYMED